MNYDCRVLSRALKVAITSLALILGIAPAVAAEDVRYIDIVSIGWTGSVTTVQLRDLESSVRNEVAPRWRGYTTFEFSKEDRSINFQLGQTLREPISLLRPMACDGAAASSFMSTVMQESYKRLGISNWAKRYLIILAPESGCIWTGRALIGNPKVPGGVMVLQNSSSAFVIAHELGHALGLGHSNLLRCDSGRSDGPWGEDCKAVEYGGAVDVMGNVDVDTPLTTYGQWLLGYLDKEEIKQSWLNETVRLTASDVSGGVRALFLRDGRSTYWVEYRRGNDRSTYKPGLVIYRTDPPPISAVVSPNPQDALSPEFDEDLTSDIWMLNWDNYTYARSRATGSMTLPAGKTATVFSGNISLVAAATSDPNQIEVTVTRRTDTNPPPTPELSDSKNWRFPGVSIVKAGYEDGESTIASFEAEISGKIVEIKGSEVENFLPTYLNPFSPPKNVFLRDLPEGKYTLAIRAIDIWGNRSEWSSRVETYVDRGDPIATSDFTLLSIDSSNTEIAWTGVRDEGIGLCSTILHNQEGFITSRSTDKQSPKFSLRTGNRVDSKFQVFDCLGNGVNGEVSLLTELVLATSSKRTGKWSSAPNPYGSGALRCTGKCTASISVSGTVKALIASGSATLSMAGKSPVVINSANSTSIRFSENLEVGDKKRVVRISGSNFVFGGLARLQFKVGQLKSIVQKPDVSDPSLTDVEQRQISRFGFSSEDFTQDWTVLPMPGGTTLLDPTLDLCSSNYASERGREMRRQVSVSKPQSPYLFLSSETVRYRNASAAQSALVELKQNFESCVKNGGGSENGILTPYIFQELPKSSARLVDEKNRVLVRATIGSGNAARQLLAFYQYNGALFTGLYVVTAGEKPIDDAEVLRWFDVAEVMAKRLNS